MELITIVGPNKNTRSISKHRLYSFSDYFINVIEKDNEIVLSNCNELQFNCFCDFIENPFTENLVDTFNVTYELLDYTSSFEIINYIFNNFYLLVFDNLEQKRIDKNILFMINISKFEHKLDEIKFSYLIKFFRYSIVSFLRANKSSIPTLNDNMKTHLLEILI